jgi:aspartate aminotransferase
MRSLSDRVKNINPSATLSLTAKVLEMKKQGIDVVALNVGEPDFGTPENICEAARRAIAAQKTKYTPVAGIPELRGAICEKLKRDNGLEYTPDCISVGSGAKQSLVNAVLSICQKGDEVILPTPCWVSYIEMVKLAGAKAVLVKTDENKGFDLDVEAVRAAVTPATKAILINSPNNPTGAVYPRETLEALAEIAKEHDFWIIADEVYEKLIYEGEHVSIASLSEDAKERTILINGISKAYSMTGWRIGYAAAPKAVIKAMNALQGHATSNPNSIAQYAAVEAYNGPQDSVETMRQEFARRRRYVYDRLCAMDGVSCAMAKGAFYLMPNVSSFYGKKAGDRVIKDSFDMADYLLEVGRIAAVPGAAFEAPDNIRISYSNSMENLTKAMDRMEEALKAVR